MNTSQFRGLLPRDHGLASLIAIAACAAASPVIAQEDTKAKPADQTTNYGEIIVTAQLREQALSDVPISVQALSEARINTEVILDTPQLVRASPSVGYTDGFSSNSTGFTVRGISSQAAEGGLQQSTAMVIDGVPVARAGEFLNDLADIERVEILRGPQGTLFGKNATAGIVSIVTRRPTDVFEGQGQFGVTTDEEYMVRGMLNVPLSDNARFRVNGFYRNLSPLLKNDGPGNDLLGYENYGFAAKLDFDLGETVNLLIGGDYRRTSGTFGQGINIVPSTGIGAAQIAILGFTPRRGVARVNTNGDQFNHAEGYSATAELGWRVNDDIKITSITGFRNFENDNANDVDGTTAGAQEGRGFTPNPTFYPVLHMTQREPRQPQAVRYLSQELRLNYAGDRFDIVGGLFYQTLRDKGSGEVPFMFSGAYLGRGADQFNTLYASFGSVQYRIQDDTAAIFGDVSFKATDQITLFGGVRFTHETISSTFSKQNYFAQITDNAGNILTNPANGRPVLDPIAGRFNLTPTSTDGYELSRVTNNVSGRFGIQWQPTDDLNFYASYNRGYKGAAVDVSRGATAPDPATGYSPILAPEIGQSYEAGAKLQLFDRRLSINLNVYSEKISNLQQSVVLPDTSTRLFNAGSVRTDGVEADFQARLTDGLSIDGALAYTNPRYAGDVFVRYCAAPAAGASCQNYNINGAQAVFSYKWRWNIGATYRNDLGSSPLNITGRVGFDWYDDTPMRVGRDPLTREPSRGMLDASLTLASDNERWEFQIYGKNLTNEFYYTTLFEVDNVISRLAGALPRDYRRYGGVRLKVKF